MKIEISDEEFEAQTTPKAKLEVGEYEMELIEPPYIDMVQVQGNERMVMEFKWNILVLDKEYKQTVWLDKADGTKMTWPLTNVLDAIAVEWSKVAGAVEFDDVACLGRTATGVFTVDKRKPTYEYNGESYPNVTLQKVTASIPF